MTNANLEMLKQTPYFASLIVDPLPNVLIVGAVSPETAVCVTDYPYGRRLRCVMRYWLEYKPKHGTRLVSQTNNPKRPGLVWNKPHAGVYSVAACVLHTNDDGHVKERALSLYSLESGSIAECDASMEKIRDFETRYATALQPHDLSFLMLAREHVERRRLRITTPHVKTKDYFCNVCGNGQTRCTGVEVFVPTDVAVTEPADSLSLVGGSVGSSYGG